MLSIAREPRLDAVFAALANERRRQIVRTLALQPASIGQLAAEQRSSLPAIHRHIRLLEGAKLVRRKKSGRVNYLALDRTGLSLLHDWVNEFQAYWGTNKETLENYVAGFERNRRQTATPKRRR